MSNVSRASNKQHTTHTQGRTMRTLAYFCVLAVCFCYVAATEDDSSDARVLSYSPVDIREGLSKLTDPRNARIVIMFNVVSFIATHLAFLILHYMFWDHDNTRPEEKFNLDNLIKTYADPENAMLNMYGVVGQGIMSGLFLAVPPLYYRAEQPRRARSLDSAEDSFHGRTIYSDGKPLFTLQTFYDTMRMHLSPMGFTQTFFLNLIITLGVIIFWAFVPLFHPYFEPEVQRRALVTEDAERHLQNLGIL